MLRLDYQTVRQYMQPGDVIAFSGRGFISKLIKFVTRSQVSHVGVIKYSDVDSGRIDIVESTTLSEDKMNGVRTRRFSEVLNTTKSSVAWLQLNDDARRRFNGKVFFDYVNRQEGKPYGYLQAIMAGLNIPTPELDAHQFCSELIAFAFQECGVLDKAVNASGTTPVELCKFDLFNPPVLLKGKEFKI